MSLHYDGDSSYLFVNRKKVNNFFWELYLKNLIKNESKEVSFKWNVYDLSVNYGSIDKSDILNIHKYLMVKNNIK